MNINLVRLEIEEKLQTIFNWAEHQKVINQTLKEVLNEINK